MSVFIFSFFLHIYRSDFVLIFLILEEWVMSSHMVVTLSESRFCK